MVSPGTRGKLVGVVLVEAEYITTKPTTIRGESQSPKFTISVFGSSWNYLFFWLIYASFLSLSMYWPPQRRDRMLRNRKGKYFE